jgi:peptidoglycan/LPS O-acetylase OafA/YrhL
MLNKQFSIYLDLVRFTAAVLVFISHVPHFAGGWGWQLSGFGHEAVVIFFVLSGFVISYVVFDKNENLQKYTVSRLSRIYSVAIPALILTVLLYYIGQEINPDAFNTLNEKLKDPIWTLASAALFINQSWIATPIFSNLPYWSLGYESLYYVFFGVLVYMKGSKKSFTLLLILIIMGPSIILYLPIWFAGVLCFRSLNKFDLNKRQAFLAYMVSVIGIIILSNEAIQNQLNSFAHQIVGEPFISLLLEPAEQFFSDYILTIFVSLHIFSSYFIFKDITIFTGVAEKIIRELSSHTFSLYLFHMPMLYFVSAIAPYKSAPILNLISAWLLIPLVILAISYFTERKKYAYQVFFLKLLKYQK